MASKQRTTKTRASRIDASYLKKASPLKRVRFLVSLVLLGAAFFVVASDQLVNSGKAVMPGPVSDKHRMFEKNCASCHTNNFGSVTNDGCLNCHADHKHNEQVKDELLCSSCHVEHQHVDLVQATQPNTCTSCHGNLERKDGKKPEVASAIHGFANDHPDWKMFHELSVDTTEVKLNHAVHLKAGLKGADGKPVTMQCSDCHSNNKEEDPTGVHRAGKVTFEDHCMSCHQLGFDTDFKDVVAPHKKPEEVFSFLEKFYREALNKNPNIMNEQERDLAGPKKREQNLSADAWLAIKIKESKDLLMNHTCKECHDMQKTDGDFPHVAEVKYLFKKLDEGTFDHASHQGLACASCHTKAPTSEKSSDILIPAIQDCTSCHSPKGSGGDSCQTCHVYHEKGLEKIMEGHVL